MPADEEGVVSKEVVDRIRIDNRRVIEHVDHLHAQIEVGEVDAALTSASSLAKRIKTHLALIDGVLDAITLDAPRDRPGSRSVPRLRKL